MKNKKMIKDLTYWSILIAFFLLKIATISQ